MKYLHSEAVLAAESAEDAKPSSELLEARLAELQGEFDRLPEAAVLERARRLLDMGYVQLDLKRHPEAWALGWEAFRLALPARAWEEAVQACDILYQSDQKDSIKALAHGIWMGVTYPVDPELSVAMLQHLIEETPAKADGAAVAAAVACYIVELRAEGKQREDLQFFTGQTLGDVARRHSGVDSQELFDFWMERMQLADPAKILPRLGAVIEVLVIDEWWFDRDQLRSELPEG